MYDFLYAKLSNYSAASIMQALDLAEARTFLSYMLVLTADVAHLPCKLSERSIGAVGVFVGQLQFIWRA